VGEVYCARETRLQRNVASKVLPAEFASDPERCARFEREAQILASLHHPHIASIFRLEESHGLRAIVMELVEGPTLAQRIAEGPVAVPDALSIALQIAQARGDAVDKRADIWAFGCVLYESLTGRKTFPDATPYDVVAAILTREPDWTALPPDTPPSARRVLRRTLEKDPKRRLRDIGDVW